LAVEPVCCVQKNNFVDSLLGGKPLTGARPRATATPTSPAASTVSGVGAGTSWTSPPAIGVHEPQLPPLALPHYQLVSPNITLVLAS